MEANNTKLPMRQRKTGEWEGDGLSSNGEKRGKWGRRRIDLAAWTECRIKIRRKGGRMEEVGKKK